MPDAVTVPVKVGDANGACDVRLGPGIVKLVAPDGNDIFVPAFIHFTLAPVSNCSAPAEARPDKVACLGFKELWRSVPLNINVGIVVIL